MNTLALRRIIDHLPRPDAQSDGELLRRFADSRDESSHRDGGSHRDEAAFAELLRRHGSLVLGVCRRVLREEHAAEDAFQAVFVQLARQAGSIRCDGSLAGWLHTVAKRVALVARRGEQRRKRRELAAGRGEARAEDMTWGEVREALDAELERLPESYRLPLILCYLEDRPQAEAAHRLGLPLPTLRGRLERGRQRLRRRLERFGLPLAAPLIVMGAGDAVGPELHAATLDAVRHALEGGSIAPSVAALAAVPALARWKIVLALGLLAILLGAGFGGLKRSPAGMLPTDPPEKAEPRRAGRVDALGDPLPDDAVLRLGTRRYRVQTWPLVYQSLPDGKAFLTYHRGTDQQDEVRWMDAATGKVTDSWKLPRDQHAAGFSPDGRFALLSKPFIFYTGLPRPGAKQSQKWALTLYDLNTRKAVWEKSEELERNDWKHVEQAVFSPDAKWVATTGKNSGGALRVWDTADGKELWARKAEGQTLEPQGFTDGGSTLVLHGNNDGDIYLVDRATGKERRTFPTVPRDQTSRVRLSADGTAVLVGTYGKAVRVWDVKTGKEREPLGGHAEWGARTAACSADGRTIATGGNASIVRIWDWPSGKFRRGIDLGRGGIGHLNLSPDGKRLEVIFWFDSAIVLYDAQTGKPHPSPANGHTASIDSIASAPDGSLVTIGRDKTVRTWDLKTGRQATQGALSDDPAWSQFALSRDGARLAVLNYGQTAIEIFDRTLKPLRTLTAARDQAVRMTFSPDGKWLGASGPYAKAVTVWDVTGDGSPRTFALRADQGGHGGMIAFSPDGRTMAADDGSLVRFWDVPTWKERPGLEAYAPAGIAFSANGRMIATAGLDGVKIWELVTRKLRAHVRPAGYPSHSLTFSASGRWLAWVSDSRKAFVWDSWTGEVLGPFEGHDGVVTGLAFSGDRFATSSEDSTILAWDVPAALAKNPSVAPRVNVNEAWRDLGSDDAKIAFEAVRVLVNAPDVALVLAREHLRPAAPGDDKQIAAWLRELDSPKYADRQKAAAGLRRAGEAAAPALSRFLAGDTSPEARKQVEQLLATLREPSGSPERLREIRALEVLERAGGPEVRRFLTELASGAKDAALTRDAEATLQRVK